MWPRPKTYSRRKKAAAEVEIQRRLFNSHTLTTNEVMTRVRQNG